MDDGPAPLWAIGAGIVLWAGAIVAAWALVGSSRQPADEEAPRPQMARQLPGDGSDSMAMPAYFKDVRTGLCFATMDPQLQSLRDAILVPCDKVVGR